MYKPQFRLRHLIILMLFAAVLTAWWADHRRQQQRIEELSAPPQWDVIVYKSPMSSVQPVYIKRLGGMPASREEE